MADIEAAAGAPPQAPPLPPPAPRRPAAAEVKAAVADAVIYSFVGAMFACSAASIALVVARYAVAGFGSSPSSYAHAVVAVARDVFLRALAAELLLQHLLSPFTIPLLLLRLDRRPPEPPEELVVIGGVYVTVQLHGAEHPGARGRRRGAGYGLIPLLVFIVLSMVMMVCLLFQERSPAKRHCVETLEPADLISDIGSFACSVMVICVFIPYMLVQLMKLPR
ncbi:unnamed protein product [Urochloa humidicola]